MRLFFYIVDLEGCCKSEKETLFLYLCIASGDVQGQVNKWLQKKILFYI